MWNEVPSKLWDLANAITAFSVAQVIAYLYLLSNPNVNIEELRYWIVALIIVFHFFYLYGICWCHATMRKLESGPAKEKFGLVSAKVKFGQIFIVVLFAIGAIIATIIIDYESDQQSPLPIHRLK